MPPEELANRIFRAVEKRQRILIPGFGNRVFALLGKWWPGLMEDMMRKVILDNHAAKQIKVSEVMTREVVTVTREDTIVHCIALTKKHHVRHLQVVEEGKAIGMISLRDLFLDVIHEKVGEVGDED